MQIKFLKKKYSALYQQHSRHCEIEYAMWNKMNKKINTLVTNALWDSTWPNMDIIEVSWKGDA